MTFRVDPRLDVEAYSRGCEDYYKYYENDLHHRIYDQDEFEEANNELMDDLAWNAWYNDSYRVPTAEMGYYLIAEMMDLDTANQYLLQMEEAGRYNHTTVRVA